MSVCDSNMAKNSCAVRARPKVDEGPIVGHSNQANVAAATLMREAISRSARRLGTSDPSSRTRDASGSAPNQIESLSTSPAFHSILQDCTAQQDPLKGTERILISLDAHCHPLSAEHPGRVWNALFHATPHPDQPIVTWAYETQCMGDGPTEFENVIAHLHVSLPDLPSKEHCIATKRWIGQPEVLKATAQCSALVACIADGGLSWAFGLATSDFELHQPNDAAADETISKDLMLGP